MASLDPGCYSKPERYRPLNAETEGLLPKRGQLELARELIESRLWKTPLMPSRMLSEETGRSVFLKLECLSAIRSFKARGALWCLASLPAEHRTHGVVTASTGNHGQGLAFAGGLLGVNVTVVAPISLDPAKQVAMQKLGAEVLIAGEDINESSETALRLAESRGLVFVEDGDDVALLAGAATVLWEMLDDRAVLDSVIVPVGGGNLVASCLWLAHVLESPIAVIGVQSAKAPGATLSWLRGAMTSAECGTAAGGLATRRPGALALDIMNAYLQTMVVVDEDDLGPAAAHTLSATGLAVELAAASGIAALSRFGPNLPGHDTGVVMTGGWISPQTLAEFIVHA